MESYPFVEWTDDHLNERYGQLLTSLNIKHTEGRREQIRREIFHLAFEVEQRLVEREPVA